MPLQTKIDEVISQAETPIQLADGLSFDTRDTIKRIRFYTNNEYVDRNDDTIFYNISESRVLHFAKNIDIDTKDMYPQGDGDVSFVQAWILEMKLQKWFEDNQVATILNDILESVPRYGSGVWKVTKSGGTFEVEQVDLNNLYFNYTVKDIRDTDKVEIHYMTESELRDKKDVWENTESLTKDKNGNFTVYEFTGWYNDEYIHAFTGEGLGKDEVLFEEEIKTEDDPYWDFHLGKYEGRWLRRGVTERLFDLQVHANRLVNQNAQAREISSLLLLKSANPDYSGNVLTDVLNGQIIMDESLEQVGLTNREFTAFVQELNMIEQKADQLAFTPEVVTGEQLPSNTPFRSVAVSTNAAKSVFRFIRQSIGEKFGHIVKSVLLKQIAKSWKTDDILEVARNERDVRIYDQALRRTTKWKFFVNRILKGETVTQEDLDEVDRRLDEQSETRTPKIKVTKDFWNVDFTIKVRVTNESMDKQQANDANFNAIQMVVQNPAINNIPLFRQYLERNGMEWWQLTPNDINQIQGGATGAKPIGEQQDKLLAQVDTE